MLYCVGNVQKLSVVTVENFQGDDEMSDTIDVEQLNNVSNEYGLGGNLEAEFKDWMKNTVKSDTADQYIKALKHLTEELQKLGYCKNLKSNLFDYTSFNEFKDVYEEIMSVKKSNRVEYDKVDKGHSYSSAGQYNAALRHYNDFLKERELSDERKMPKVVVEVRKEFFNGFGRFLESKHPDIHKRLSTTLQSSGDSYASYSLGQEKTADLSYAIMFKNVEKGGNRIGIGFWVDVSSKLINFRKNANAFVDYMNSKNPALKVVPPTGKESSEVKDYKKGNKSVSVSHDIDGTLDTMRDKWNDYYNWYVDALNALDAILRDIGNGKINLDSIVSEEQTDDAVAENLENGKKSWQIKILQKT